MRIFRDLEKFVPIVRAWGVGVPGLDAAIIELQIAIGTQNELGSNALKRIMR